MDCNVTVYGEFTYNSVSKIFQRQVHNVIKSCMGERHTQKTTQRPTQWMECNSMRSSLKLQIPHCS